MGVDPHDFEVPPAPPLGELLLARGLITPEQLEQALANQGESGRPLGEIFIRLGFTSGPMIAQALATQHGRMLKSEYGFATGFDAVFSTPENALPDPPTAAVSPTNEQPARASLKIVDPIESAAPVARHDEEQSRTLELQPTKAEAAADASRHLVFFLAVGRGYVLLERQGPAPAVGEVLDTSADGGSEVMYVMKVARPPVPGPRLRCAYLL